MEQLVAPVTPTYAPAAQFEQVPAPEAEYFPRAQLKHNPDATAALKLENAPAAHIAQTAEPVLPW